MAGVWAAVKAGARVFSAIACKVACGKLPKTNSLDPSVWNKWTEGLVPRDIDLPSASLVVFNPDSNVPANWTGETADFTLIPTNITGVQFGNFTDLLDNVFGDWIQVDESAPKPVKVLFQALDDLLDEGGLQFSEVKQLLDMMVTEES